MGPDPSFSIRVMFCVTEGSFQNLTSFLPSNSPLVSSPDPIRCHYPGLGVELIPLRAEANLVTFLWFQRFSVEFTQKSEDWQ
jgi:hypothetical protein